MFQSYRPLVFLTSRYATLVLTSACLFSLCVGEAHARPAHRGDAIEPAGTIALTSVIPDPGYCSVSPCDELNGIVLAPDSPIISPATQVMVEVRNSVNAPLPDAAVAFQFSSDNTLCPSAVLLGTTDANGRVEFVLPGGGCAVEPLAGLIKANGVTIRAYSNVKSPDYDGVGGDGLVNMSDLVAFSHEFLGATASGCHDYDNNGTSDLGDLIILAPLFSSGSTCR